MKKIVLSLASIALLASCGGESANNDASKVPTKDSSAVSTPVLEKICKKGYDKESTSIGFGGFKTTEKKEVKGYFKEFTIDSTTVADSPEEVFANAIFSVPVNYLETNDLGRNGRIIDEYFGNMEETSDIKGKVIGFDSDSNKVNVEITLNAITQTVALNYAVSGDTISLNGSINILDFNGSKALAALNTACEVLHKGADGVSKTWADVSLYISSVVKEACE